MSTPEQSTGAYHQHDADESTVVYRWTATGAPSWCANLFGSIFRIIAVDEAPHLIFVPIPSELTVQCLPTKEG